MSHLRTKSRTRNDCLNACRVQLGSTAGVEELQRMRMSSWWILALLLGWSATAQTAHAQQAKKAPSKADKSEQAEADDDAPKVRPISVSLLAGYGHTFNAHDHLNPLAIGFGVRGGYNIGGLYLGARFMFFLGDSEKVDTVEVSANTMTLGLEGGYDLALAKDVLVLRPELGVGLDIVEGESMNSGATMDTSDGSSEDLYIAPGAALLVNVGERSLIGVDLQAPIIFADDIEVALTMLAAFGMHF